MAIKIDNSEAKNKLIETRKEVQKLEKTLEELEATGKKETDEYKEKRKQLRKLNQSYNDLRKEAGLNALTYNELRKSARSLKSQLEKTVPDSDQYKELQRDLEITIKRMKELKGVSVDTSFSFSKLADGFNRYGALIASGIASVTGLTLTMRKCVDAYAEMEEAQSQVIKYTGLSKDEVRELNEEFKNLDTRTPRTRLNELAGDAGKLGISAKKDVMEFVQAADMINVALGEDLGKDAITQIGKLAQMFGDGDRSLKDNMLAVGSAVNSVAQSSSASEPYLVEFTARMGGVGKQAKLAVTDIMGFASALDQNMLRSEMASTALSGLILKLYQEPAKYAKLAGIQVEEFTKLMAEDANEAVLVFLEALNRLGGMEQLAPVLDKMSLSGAEAASVISTLAGSVAQVRKEQQGANQAFIEGTSIVNEFAVQNSTVQAELDKAKQRFHDITVELGEQLLPLMKYMVTTGSLTVKALSAIVSALIDYKGILVAAAVAIGTYTTVTKLATIATVAGTTATKLATVAQAAFNAVTKLNPWTALISGAMAAATYFGFFADKTDEATESQKKLNEALNQNARDMSAYNSVTTRSQNLDQLNDRQKRQLRSDAEAELKIVEDKLAEENILHKKYIKEQKELIESRIDISDSYKEILIKNLELETQGGNKAIKELVRQKNELNRIIKGLPKVSDMFTTPSTADNDKKIQQAKSEYEQQVKLLQHQHAVGLIEEEEYQKKLYDIEIKFLSKKKQLLVESKRSSAEVDEQILQAMITEANRLNLKKINYTATDEDDNSIYTPSVIEEKDPEEDNYEVYKFKESLDGQLAVLNAFHEAGLISEMEYQDKLTEITKQKEEERNNIRQTAFDTAMNLLSSVSQLMTAMQDSEISAIERRYDKMIESAEKSGKDTSKLEEEKEEAVLNVKRKYADKQFALSVLQVTAATTVAAMEAYSAMAGIKFIGPVLGAAAAAAAVAAGAAQIAIAKQQRDEAKGLYTGGYSKEYVSGYTKKGDSRDVAGVIPVHKNEFVANHKAVANPAVKQFLDVFDIAQKNGTIGFINTTQILEQVRTKAGRYVGGYTDSGTATVSNNLVSGVYSSDSVKLLQLILSAIREGNGHLKIIAAKKLVVDVRSVRDGIKRLETLERNASR